MSKSITVYRYQPPPPSPSGRIKLADALAHLEAERRRADQAMLDAVCNAVELAAAVPDDDAKPH
jgi:hypothetical protein